MASTTIQSQSTLNIDSILKNVSRKNSIKSAEDVSDNEYETGGISAIGALVDKSKMFGQIASASFNQNDSYEPLPIMDSNLFEETRGSFRNKFI